MAATTWNVTPGETRTRADIAGEYSGSKYNGITPLSSSPNIVVYSDPEKGTEFGYDYDGWDASGELYYYTGEGASGDQRFDRGNKAIAEHKAQHRALRLFIAVGTVEGTDTRIHQYAGEFEIESADPFLIRTAPGQDKILRKVIVFRLRPVGTVVADRSHLSAIEGSVPASKVETVSVEAVPEAAVNNERAEFERTGNVVAEQREAALTGRFRTYLEAAPFNREIKRYKITTPTGVLYTDTADITAGVVYEAKGTAERMSVRLALGQVLDYGRYVEGAELSVLLPSSPAADLVELLRSFGIGCVVEGKPGEFTDMTGLGRCP
jgi:hypothetical protein